MQAMGSLVVFVVVFRTNLGWSRYWEAITQLHFMYSKWTDAFSQFCAFTDVSACEHREKGALEKAEYLTRICESVLNDYMLLSVVVCDRLARGDNARMHHRTVTRQPWSDQITMRSALWKEANTSHRASRRAGDAMPRFYLIDDVAPQEQQVRDRRSRHELDGIAAGWEGAHYPILRTPLGCKESALSLSTDRPQQVMFWIVHSLSKVSNKLIVAPPIQSRMYQELSNGMLGFSNVLKIADVPFPFPHAQIIMVLVLLWMCLIPIFMMVFTKSLVAGPILSLFLGMSTWAFNELAIELEDPFGLDANDLSLQDFHLRFLLSIKEIYDSAVLADTFHDAELSEIARRSSSVAVASQSSMLGREGSVSSAAAAKVDSLHGSLSETVAKQQSSMVVLEEAAAAARQQVVIMIDPEKAVEAETRPVDAAASCNIGSPPAQQLPAAHQLRTATITIGAGDDGGGGGAADGVTAEPPVVVLDAHLRHISERMEQHLAQIAMELRTFSRTSLDYEDRRPLPGVEDQQKSPSSRSGSRRNILI
eukprot:TRINITY_DN3204_c0_g1_i1.p1 TRINITY_DN3204_c0_g1~~TRINITY_DN3204_c0_g1_i1.p1  ORF type:complete len:620 (-),score=110.06 TRINITY_DN3204_c0_g1_i1:110-1714(-)